MLNFSPRTLNGDNKIILLQDMWESLREPIEMKQNRNFILLGKKTGRRQITEMHIELKSNVKAYIEVCWHQFFWWFLVIILSFAKCIFIFKWPMKWGKIKTSLVQNVYQHLELPCLRCFYTHCEQYSCSKLCFYVVQNWKVEEGIQKFKGSKI